ncbi:hypothetical protein WJ32_25115 [Burkholderia ubonensis]|nr:hypothetical protein WJ32_25115 [Burkholderia ubonensis]
MLDTREAAMVFGVIIWVALAALFPTMVVPTIQHAIAPSSMSVAPDAQPREAAPGAPHADASAPSG